ncbi:unnamed protein product [Caenorhabditis angaria]|uniref:Uncharacterized protein n=1 Tax=Caenorhabditis angaria TaxID=860376 RepID=A0A9P1J4Q6_9PELO|nr:unnamed protein product [Caenorhabditis angaria]
MEFAQNCYQSTVQPHFSSNFRWCSNCLCKSRIESKKPPPNHTLFNMPPKSIRGKVNERATSSNVNNPAIPGVEEEDDDVTFLCEIEKPKISDKNKEEESNKDESESDEEEEESEDNDEEDEQETSEDEKEKENEENTEESSKDSSIQIVELEDDTTEDVKENEEENSIEIEEREEEADVPTTSRKRKRSSSVEFLGFFPSSSSNSSTMAPKKARKGETENENPVDARGHQEVEELDSDGDEGEEDEEDNAEFVKTFLKRQFAQCPYVFRNLRHVSELLDYVICYLKKDKELYYKVTHNVEDLIDWYNTEFLVGYKNWISFINDPEFSGIENMTANKYNLEYQVNGSIVEQPVDAHPVIFPTHVRQRLVAKIREEHETRENRRLEEERLMFHRFYEHQRQMFIEQLRRSRERWEQYMQGRRF